MTTLRVGAGFRFDWRGGIGEAEVYTGALRATSTSIVLHYSPEATVELLGRNLNFNSMTGTLNGVIVTKDGHFTYDLSNFSISMPQFTQAILGGSGDFFVSVLSNQSNVLIGAEGNDYLPVVGKNIIIDGGGGYNTADFTPSNGHRTDFIGVRHAGDVALWSKAGSSQTIKLTNVQALHFVDGNGDPTSLPQFPGFKYIAGYTDLMNALGANDQLGWQHFWNNGLAEGRTSGFRALEYTASYADLTANFGTNEATASAHYITRGRFEGRSISFDGLAYIASNSDLIANLPHNGDAGASHYLTHGRVEGRHITFDALEYVASYGDLIHTFHTNAAAATNHYIESGYYEHRATASFNAAQYLANYADLRGAFGGDKHAATIHWIQYGYDEHRTDHVFAH